jgi:hypothetical protein
MEKKQEKENKKEHSKKSNVIWYIEIFIITFILSLIFSYISTNGVSKLSLIPAIFVLILVIFVGILFDIVGVAVTVANEEEFHAKATKKVKGAKTSIQLIKNAPKPIIDYRCIASVNINYQSLSCVWNGLLTAPSPILSR